MLWSHTYNKLVTIHRNYFLLYLKIALKSRGLTNFGGIITPILRNCLDYLLDAAW